MKQHRLSDLKENEFLLFSRGVIGRLSPSLVKKGYGEPVQKAAGVFWLLMPCEAAYLLERQKIKVFYRGEEVNFEALLRFFSRIRDFPLRFLVYRDLRSRGYIPKEGLKFGTDFRVYPQGIKVASSGEKRFSSHAPYLVKIISSRDKLRAQELVGLTRVAASVNKRLLFAIIDGEGDITYIFAARYIL